jgi:hydrogenase maturation protease
MEERRVTSVAGPVLVIGYGNSLRGDDGAGLEVARLLAKYRLPNVQIRQAVQLMPELATEVATARAAIFVDANSAAEGAGAAIHPVKATERGANPGHLIAPQDILRLAIECYGKAPPSWVVAVGGREFDYRYGLSAHAKSNVRVAVRLIKEHINHLADDGNRVSAEADTIVF